MSIIAAADGSALGNPGPAGWAWYIDDDTWRAGGWDHGTNNMGELKAVLDLLEATRADREEHLEILCDSQYVINSVTRWMPGWKRKGWRKRDGKPVLNVDLLKAIDRELTGRSVEFTWVKGHAGHAMNEAADERARAAATAFSRGQDPDIGPGYQRGATRSVPAPPADVDARPSGEQDLFSLFDAPEPPTSTPAGTDVQQVIDRELALHGDALRADPSAAAALLHPDFTEVGASGRTWNRADMLAALAPVDGGIDADSFRADQVAPGVMLLHYETHTAHGRARRTSLWLRDGEQWLLRHHQGTPVPSAP